MKRLLINTLIVSSLVIGSGLADIAPNISFNTAQAEEAAKKKTRRVPAMGSRVYSQLARAQEMADGGDVPAAIEVLDKVKSKASSLNSYEMAMMYNFYGFIYYNNEQVSEAIASFEQVVAQKPIPESLEQATVFTLAQLAMANGLYDKTITYLERWEEIKGGEVPVKNLVLKAQASYQRKYYEDASGYINAAIEKHIADGYRADENWYVLQRAIYFELKQPEKVVEVLETMVRLFNKPEYWVQLGGMYGEVGEEEKQLAVMEAAYQQGFITKQSDFRNLAQIYFFHGLPYKSAAVMDKGLSEGVIDKSEKNLNFLAQSWLGAKEYDKSVNTYAEVAKLSENGMADQQIAEIRLQQGNFKAVIAAGEEAQRKGGLKNPGNLYLALGMASFNIKAYDKAIAAFTEAKGITASKRMATQWLKFVEREKKNAEALAQ